MVARHADKKPLVHKMGAREPRALVRTVRQHGNVAAAGGKIALDLLEVRHARREPHPGIKATNTRREHPERGRRARDHLDGAQAPVVCLHFRDARVDLGQHAARALGRQPARLAELDLVLAAIEKRHAKLLLDALHRAGNRGRRHIELARDLRERAQLVERHQLAQLFKIHGSPPSLPSFVSAPFSF